MKLQELHEAAERPLRQFADDMETVAEALLANMSIPDEYRIRQFGIDANSGHPGIVDLDVQLVSADVWGDEEELELLLKLVDNPRNEQVVKNALASNVRLPAGSKRVLRYEGARRATSTTADGMARVYKHFVFKTTPFKPSAIDRAIAASGINPVEKLRAA